MTYGPFPQTRDSLRFPRARFWNPRARHVRFPHLLLRCHARDNAISRTEHCDFTHGTLRFHARDTAISRTRRCDFSERGTSQWISRDFSLHSTLKVEWSEKIAREKFKKCWNIWKRSFDLWTNLQELLKCMETIFLFMNKSSGWRSWFCLLGRSVIFIDQKLGVGRIAPEMFSQMTTTWLILLACKNLLQR